jgi:prepilin-type processing-associated H-X9-DG protein
MWNPIARLTGTASPPPPGGVVRGVGAEKAHHYDKPYNQYSRRRLAELCVAGVVIGFAFYLFIPTLAGTAESARRATCSAHLRRLAQAAEMYQTDNDGYPPTVGWVRALYPLFTDRDGVASIFCPSEQNLPRPLRRTNWENSSYSYRNPAPAGVVADESATPLFWDYLGGSGVGAHPGGGNVVYVDGHLAWRPHTSWQTSDQP